MAAPVDYKDSGTVLNVISSLGALGGGAERQLLLYLQNRTGAWKHVVAYRKRRTLLANDFEAAGVSTVWLGSGRFLVQLRRLVQLARTYNVDLIHTHLAEANILGRAVGRILGIPVVSTLVNTLEVEDRVASRAYTQPWKYRLSIALERWSAWGTCRFIAITEAVKESAARTLGISPSRVRVVYRAVLAPMLSDELAPDRQDPVLICVGRLVPHKAQDFLIRMFALVLQKWPDARLQLVGIGPEEQNLERLACQLGVSSRVQFLGLRNDVYQLLQQADLFVYASWFEGFSLVIGEATAMGLPVVAVDLPVTRETAPSSSVLLVPRDEKAFAATVLDVLDNLASFREAARRDSGEFRERFSVERFVLGTEGVYTEVVRSQAAATRSKEGVPWPES